MTGDSGVKRMRAGFDIASCTVTWPRLFARTQGYLPCRGLRRYRLPREGDLMPVTDYAETARLAEELRALQAVQAAAGDLGRARRYGWPSDKQAILSETLAAARARFRRSEEQDRESDGR